MNSSLGTTTSDLKTQLWVQGLIFPVQLYGKPQKFSEIVCLVSKWYWLNILSVTRCKSCRSLSSLIQTACWFQSNFTYGLCCLIKQQDTLKISFLDSHDCIWNIESDTDTVCKDDLWLPVFITPIFLL